MAYKYQRGDLLPVVFSLWQFGGSYLPNITLGVSKHDFDLEALTFDTTGALSGGLTMRIGGKADYKANVEAFYDLDASPYLAPPGILPGATGVIAHFISSALPGYPARAFQFPAIVKKLHWAIAVTNAVLYNFDVEMAAQYGTIIIPAA